MECVCKLFTPLQSKDTRKYVRKYFSRSRVHKLPASSDITPTCCSTNLSTFCCGNSKLAGLTNAYMEMGCNTPQAMQLLRLCFCPKMASEAISEHLISKNFLGGHAPDPPSLAYLHAYTYRHQTSLLKFLGL